MYPKSDLQNLTLKAKHVTYFRLNIQLWSWDLSETKAKVNPLHPGLLSERGSIRTPSEVINWWEVFSFAKLL